MRAKKITVAVMICVCAVLFTITGAMARYNTSVSANASAEVAAFAFTADATPHPNTPTVQIESSGSTIIGTLSVQNTENGKVSDVKQEYRIVLTSDVSLPAAIAPELVCNGKTYYATTDNERKTFEFSHADFKLNKENPETYEYAIGLSWLPAASVEEMNINFSVKVVATQTD